MIACKDQPLLREEDEILNSHRSIFICKAECRAVTGNHKVLDSWKQLKGFSVCAAWLITSMHMLAYASGQPRFIPLLFNRALGFFVLFFVFLFFSRPPANMLAGSVSLTADCGGWTHLRFRVRIWKHLCMQVTGFDWKCPETFKKEMSQHSRQWSSRLFTEPLTSSASREQRSPAMNEDFPDHP